MDSFFIQSSTDKFPQHDLNEIVVVGRSNVGKSTLINKILNKDLARTSQSPGKTQLINFYSKENKYCIVDVPGFGFAKTSKELHQSWAKMVESYLSARTQLKGALLLVDCRREIEDMEKDVLYFFDHYKIPYAVVVTKFDKLKENEKAKVKKNYEHYQKNVFFVSSENGRDILTLENFIYKTWIQPK